MFSVSSLRSTIKLKNFVGSLCNSIFKRDIFLSHSVFLKEIQETKIGNKLIIEGNILPAPWESRILKTTLNPEICSICSLDVEVKHTDVAILSQFVRSDGCMLPRRITGLCKLQQKRISKMVAMAQKAGLMSILTPENSKKDPKKRLKWKKFNTYFDESTIKTTKTYKSFPVPWSGNKL